MIVEVFSSLHDSIILCFPEQEVCQTKLAHKRTSQNSGRTWDRVDLCVCVCGCPRAVKFSSATLRTRRGTLCFNPQFIPRLFWLAVEVFSRVWKVNPGGRNETFRERENRSTAGASHTGTARCSTCKLSPKQGASTWRTLPSPSASLLWKKSAVFAKSKLGTWLWTAI